MSALAVDRGVAPPSVVDATGDSATVPNRMTEDSPAGDRVERSGPFSITPSWPALAEIAAYALAVALGSGRPARHADRDDRRRCRLAVLHLARLATRPAHRRWPPPSGSDSRRHRPVRTRRSSSRRLSPHLRLRPVESRGRSCPGVQPHARHGRGPQPPWCPFARTATEHPPARVGDQCDRLPDCRTIRSRFRSVGSHCSGRSRRRSWSAMPSMYRGDDSASGGSA